MPPTLVYALLAVYLPLAAISSPFLQDLEQRAPRSCTNPYVNQQLRACPTATQFCSKFLRTFPPIATTMTATTRVSQAPTTSTVTTGETPVTTMTFPQPPAACQPTEKRDANAEAQPAQPTAFGPSCNVHSIAPSKVDNACSCLAGFSYTGKRPKPTTTVTITSTAVSISTPVTSVPVPTATEYDFVIKPHENGNPILEYVRLLDSFERGHSYLALEPGANRPDRNHYPFALNPVDHIFRTGGRSGYSFGTLYIASSTPGDDLHDIQVAYNDSKDKNSAILCDPLGTCGKLNCRFYNGEPAYFFGGLFTESFMNQNQTFTSIYTGRFPDLEDYDTDTTNYRTFELFAQQPYQAPQSG